MLDDPLCRALNDFYWNVAVKLRSNLVISTIVIVCIDLALIVSGYVISESASEASNIEANDLWQRLFYFVCTMVLVFLPLDINLGSLSDLRMNCWVPLLVFWDF
jgi:hypothetical protein